MYQKKNIAACIIFSIITCGIYQLYWIVCLNEESSNAAQDSNRVSGAGLILLSIITCGIYYVYWCYKLGRRMDTINQVRNGFNSSNAILFPILAVLQFSIVGLAIAQDELNRTYPM